MEAERKKEMKQLIAEEFLLMKNNAA